MSSTTRVHAPSLITVPGLGSLGPFSDFPTAAAAILECLHAQFGVELCAVARQSGESWLALCSVERTGFYEVKAGNSWPWADTMCSRMADGRGPRFAPDLAGVPVYREVSYADTVGAYLGVPLCRRDGQLFGTLCAFNPRPLPDELGGLMPLVEVTGRLLSTLLDHELIEAEQRRQLERVEAEALRDGLTGLWNRRAWDRFLDREEAASQRYGHPACVLAIDLDGLKVVNDTQGHEAGDAFLRRAGRALACAVGERDVAARIGGDEFGVLAVDCGEAEAGRLRERIVAELGRNEVEASIGLAMRSSATGLREAFQIADASMYEHKRSRKRARV